MGKNKSDEGYSIAVDGSGNIYVTGYLTNSQFPTPAGVDFDPGAGTEILNSNGESDIFIAKYDSNGNYKWAKNIGGTSNDEGKGIAVDNSSGYVYITGFLKVVV